MDQLGTSRALEAERERVLALVKFDDDARRERAVELFGSP
jgi:hypothetical protein